MRQSHTRPIKFRCNAHTTFWWGLRTNDIRSPSPPVQLHMDDDWGEILDPTQHSLGDQQDAGAETHPAGWTEQKMGRDQETSAIPFTTSTYKHWTLPICEIKSRFFSWDSKAAKLITKRPWIRPAVPCPYSPTVQSAVRLWDTQPDTWGTGPTALSGEKTLMASIRFCCGKGIHALHYGCRTNFVMWF